MSLLFNCFNFTHVAEQGLDHIMFVFRSLLFSQLLRYLSEVQPRNCTVLSTVFIRGTAVLCFGALFAPSCRGSFYVPRLIT